MAPNPTPSRFSPVLIWGSAIVILVLAVFAVRSLTKERVAVHTAPATYQDLSLTISTNGKVEPIDDFQAHSQEAGVVQDVYVHLGQEVKPGQLLVRMDDSAALANLAHAQSTLDSARLAEQHIQQGGTQEELNASTADVNRLRLQMQQDSASLAALQKLQQQGAASAGEVAAAQHRLEIDQNALKAAEQHTSSRYAAADRTNAQAQVADAAAAVAAAQSSISHQDVRSPIAGSVYYLPVSRYESVDAKDDLVYVADLTRLRVTAYFDEPEIGKLANGQAVRIKWDARPDRIWHGHVSQAPTTVISYGTRNVGECLITVDDADGILQPNANVTVTVTVSQVNHALAVPRESLHFDGPQAIVYRVINDKLTRTPVRVGIVNYTWAQILDGLSEGEVVARNATTNRDLTAGLEVTPVQ